VYARAGWLARKPKTNKNTETINVDLCVMVVSPKKYVEIGGATSFRHSQ
jgi:hypothetical protein